MGNRVTTEDVKDIIETSLTDLDMFIAPANLVVTEVLGDSGLADSHLKEIERWLSAHFVAIRDPRASEEKVGDASVKYALGSNVYSGNKSITGLNATPYGQQVLVLDTTGKLLESLNKRRANLQVIG